MSNLPSMTDLPPGTAFGRYEIVRRLGLGGMGVVYEANHIDLRKRVAIKFLLAEVANNSEVRARFVREGEVASRIRHPHVVDIYDVGVLGEAPYLVMEFLEGEDLAAAVSRGPLPVSVLADIFLPVVGALA